jgi:hypothetical protein
MGVVATPLLSQMSYGHLVLHRMGGADAVVDAAVDAAVTASRVSFGALLVGAQIIFSSQGAN